MPVGTAYLDPSSSGLMFRPETSLTDVRGHG
jgi:hypothetical protein